MTELRKNQLWGGAITIVTVLSIVALSFSVRPAPKPVDPQPEIKTFGAVGDATPIPIDSDATPVVQALLDAGAPIELPAARITLNRPVYLGNNSSIRGAGIKSEVYTANRDAFVACPPGQRSYDPTPHFVTNSVDSTHWAFRSKVGTNKAGIRFQNTMADAGWANTDNWRAVRQFAVEMTIVRNYPNGVIAGHAWAGGPSGYTASPWLIYSHSERPEHVDFRLNLANDTEANFRTRIGGPGGNAFKLVFKVNLDAGTVICEKDGTVITDIQSVGAALNPGTVLMENRGSPLWLGGGNHQAGGPCPPEVDSSDTTFHTFRLWKTATPPASGYDPFGWIANTVFVLPFNEASKSKVGDPAVGFTGEQTAFGYLVPFTNDPGWVVGVRLADLCLVGETYGTGLSINSAIDVYLRGIHVNKFRVGVQIMGGPLPCYPVRIRDLTGEHQFDCLARIQRSIVPEFENITAKYPRRSVARFDGCGMVYIRDVFHAPEGAGPGNTVTDVIRLDRCIKMSVDNVLSNYEDGPTGGPRFSYIRVTGSNPEPSQTQLLRVRDFALQSLRPTARFIDDVGLPASCKREITDSFDLP